jgi:hypothetical protein
MDSHEKVPLPATRHYSSLHPQRKTRHAGEPIVRCRPDLGFTLVELLVVTDWVDGRLGHRANGRARDADLVLIGRELLREPYWAIKAQQELGEEPTWPIPYGYAVKRRAK